MTPLRKRMIRELELRRKAPGTVSSYVKAVEELARYYRRSPDRISTEEIRDYMHFLIRPASRGFPAEGMRIQTTASWRSTISGCRAMS